MQRVLVIEDDVLIANIYCSKFRGEGYQVEVAHDGQAGITLAGKFNPDLVLLDLVLPKLNGVEVIKQLRAAPQTKAVPILVLSNSYLSNLVQEAWRAGANKCLSKTDCTPKQVIEVARGLLTPAAPAPAPAPAAPVASPQAAPAPPSAAAAAGSETDDAFQAELRTTFLDGRTQTMSALRGLLQSVSRSETDGDRLAKLQELTRHTRQLAGNAGIVGMVQLSRLASAIEALLRSLYEKPNTITPSTLRTLAQAVDFLGNLFDHGLSSGESDLAATSTLVVDDEIISRRAVTHALDRAGLKSVAVEDPLVALQLVTENQFDLIISDVEMPQMNGFELCKRLRTTPRHAQTPVVFVTTHTDFESRAKSVVSGGNDMIAKPFLFMELAVKALTHILRRRLGQGVAAKAPAP
jgi:CheY-like chemotaxis protein